MMETSQRLETLNFSSKLLTWWDSNGRRFLWRETDDLYAIFLSEILLHRTRAEQVLPVYVRFIEEFPTLDDLSNAELDLVTHILQPIGLRWRTTLLVKAVKLMVSKHAGKIPSKMTDLKSLPGVSDYIASAISCFGYGNPEVLLDTNIVRVLGRLFNQKVTDSSRRSARFSKLANELLDRTHPKEFNYAMIDLAALICKPRRPHCDICPVKCCCLFVSSDNSRAQNNK